LGTGVLQLRLTTRRELEAARLQHQQERDALVEHHTAAKLKVGEAVVLELLSWLPTPD
jgi:hypothetical protein